MKSFHVSLSVLFVCVIKSFAYVCMCVYELCNSPPRSFLSPIRWERTVVVEEVL